MKKYFLFFAFTSIMLHLCSSCGKEKTLDSEINCYTCETVYIETTDPPTPGYPDTLIFEEEYCGNLEDFERMDTTAQDVLDVVLTTITVVTCQ